jgi:hypothetical protein
MTDNRLIQQLTSKNTSINKNKLPKIISGIQKVKGWIENSRNLDLGGGKYDNVTAYLNKTFNIENIIYDPFNRSKEHNEMVGKFIEKNKVDTVTISNVLCVIRENEIKLRTLMQAYEALKPGGMVYISVYEGNKTGIGRKTGTDQWQENSIISNYTPLVNSVFGSSQIKYNMIIAKKPD